MDKKVLIGAFANALDLTSRLDQLDREYKAIDNLWRRETSLDFVGIPYAKAEDIFQPFKNPLYQGKIAGFHFAGHAGHTQMIMEGVGGGEVRADGKALASYLGTVKGLQLVFLNGCATAPLAEALLDAKIPVVIATAYKVQDKMAADLAINFYQELSLGKSIGAAFVAARSQVNIVDGKQKTIQVRAYHREIPLSGATPEEVENDSFPWGLYYQAGIKPEELYLFDPPAENLIRLQDDSGKSFILEMKALEQAGMRERLELLLKKKQMFEKELIYATDPAVIFNLEYRLKEMNKKLNDLSSQLGILNG